jgi:hypothetical protein
VELHLDYTADFKGLAKQAHDELARGITNAREIIGTRAKLLLRSDVRSAGLGDKLANSWRYKGYQETPLMQTAFIYSSAPKLIQAFSETTVIRAVNARYLAIPTENTPRKGRRKATPAEVEATFGQKLIFIHGKGRQILAFVDVVAAKSGRGFRKATKQRTKDGRQKQLVLMFVMVPQVTLRKRLRWPQIFEDLKAAWPQIMAAEISKSMSG